MVGLMAHPLEDLGIVAGLGDKLLDLIVAVDYIEAQAASIVEVEPVRVGRTQCG